MIDQENRTVSDKEGVFSLGMKVGAELSYPLYCGEDEYTLKTKWGSDSG